MSQQQPTEAERVTALQAEAAAAYAAAQQQQAAARVALAFARIHGNQQAGAR
jgi:hypothetical protein